MRKIYKLFTIVALVFMTAFAGYAQTRTVEVPGWAPPYSGNPDDFNNILYNAIDNDSTLRKTSPNVIYLLKRDHKYPQGEIIQNYDFHLQIVGEDGAGLLPELIVGKKLDGTYGNDYIRAYNNMTIKNIAFTGVRPDDAYLNRMVEQRGKKSRTIFENVIFDQDRGGCIVIDADSCTLYAKDVIVGNCGHRVSVGGNGRFMDLRPGALYIDTILIENSTYSFSSDRFLRNMNTTIGYIKLDHISMINSVGMYGGLQLGQVKGTAIVTNSLFANPISNGHTELRAVENKQPGGHFSAITLDNTDAQNLIVKNNNVYYDDVITAVWAKYDSVTAPDAVSPNITTQLGAEAANATFSEILTFTKACDPISLYVDAYYTNPAAATFPENWCVGGDGGFFPDEMDFSYSATSVSATAGDGYPVGNLMYWPAQKADWEAGVVISVQDEIANSRTLRNYPNPFSESTTIAYVLKGSSDVSLEVYDVTGRKVSTLVNEFQSVGFHEVTFNASDLPGGVYLYKLSSGTDTMVQKMLLKK